MTQNSIIGDSKAVWEASIAEIAKRQFLIVLVARPDLKRYSKKSPIAPTELGGTVKVLLAPTIEMV